MLIHRRGHQTHPPPNTIIFPRRPSLTAILATKRIITFEGRREGGKEGRREGGKEGRREGGKEWLML